MIPHLTVGQLIEQLQRVPEHYPIEVLVGVCDDEQGDWEFTSDRLTVCTAPDGWVRLEVIG